MQQPFNNKIYIFTSCHSINDIIFCAARSFNFNLNCYSNVNLCRIFAEIKTNSIGSIKECLDYLLSVWLIEMVLIGMECWMWVDCRFYIDLLFIKRIPFSEMWHSCMALVWFALNYGTIATKMKWYLFISISIVWMLKTTRYWCMYNTIYIHCFSLIIISSNKTQRWPKTFDILSSNQTTKDTTHKLTLFG